MAVCSRHFKTMDYVFPDISSKYHRLKKTAVPFWNQPNMIVNEEVLQKQKQRYERRCRREAVKEKLTPEKAREKCMSDESAHEEMKNNSNKSTPVPKQIEMNHNKSNSEEMETSNNLISERENLTDEPSFDTTEDVDVQNEKFHDVGEQVYTPEHCARVFKDTILLLSSCLEVAITWPSREEISRNVPLCFEKFPNVRVVLDCTEIHIQDPKNLCYRVLTYSHYKGTKTFKIMTGVTPAGNISFVSETFGGRASDKAIFERSKLFELLEPGDAVMVDKGFLIDEICELHNVKVVRPPFLRKKRQFSKSEANETRLIASARVHIERSNERLKKFKILGTTMPNNLVPIAKEIFRVICATVNLSSPILSDEKFIVL